MVFSKRNPQVQSLLSSVDATVVPRCFRRAGPPQPRPRRPSPLGSCTSSRRVLTSSCARCCWHSTRWPRGRPWAWPTPRGTCGSCGSPRPSTAPSLWPASPCTSSSWMRPRGSSSPWQWSSFSSWFWVGVPYESYSKKTLFVLLPVTYLEEKRLFKVK